jgi:hypothetical protein
MLKKEKKKEKRGGIIGSCPHVPVDNRYHCLYVQITDKENIIHFHFISTILACSNYFFNCLILLKLVKVTVCLSLPKDLPCANLSKAIVSFSSSNLYNHLAFSHIFDLLSTPPRFPSLVEPCVVYDF